MLETLHTYLEKGLVYKQVHPTLPLTIWNYSPTCQYENAWDDITLMCRGLVTDDKGNIVARPFKKFFNLEEQKHTPTEEFEVFEKMDGSLGIVFKYNNEVVYATRGSFTSDQAMWMSKYGKEYNFQDILVEGHTYLFEIIYPENRIVVDYGKQERLVLLGIIKTESGEEIPYDDISFDGWDIVEKYNGIRDYSELKDKIRQNHEGFVIRFSNGDRIKIKGEEYLRLHKIMTEVSTTAIWEVLSEGGSMDALLKDVPDEFYKKIKNYENELKYQHYRISEFCGKSHDYFRYGKYNDKEIEPTRKQFAEHVMNDFVPYFRPIMFLMWDGKDYNKAIWNLIKPTWKKL